MLWRRLTLTAIALAAPFPIALAPPSPPPHPVDAAHGARGRAQKLKIPLGTLDVLLPDGRRMGGRPPQHAPLPLTIAPPPPLAHAPSRRLPLHAPVGAQQEESGSPSALARSRSRVGGRQREWCAAGSPSPALAPLILPPTASPPPPSRSDAARFVEKVDSIEGPVADSSNTDSGTNKVASQEGYFPWKEELECLVRGGLPMALRGEMCRKKRAIGLYRKSGMLFFAAPPHYPCRSPDREKESTFAAGRTRRVEVEHTLTEAQRDEFEDMLHALTLERSQIRAAMGFALDNVDAAGEILLISFYVVLLPAPHDWMVQDSVSCLRAQVLTA
ncbi:hypothetical protein ZWY2020_041411 [Hordeum vulgare]|nr:hypothetical protein ZWY2020_041411 [Hordeum vulgare]